MTGIFLNTIDGKSSSIPPVWMMRQAGRYLPEYREIRSKVPAFLDFCYNPKLAAEATLQPIRRFGFDAAIMFSDILVMPDALGQKVWFETGEGPKLAALENGHDIAALLDEVNLERLSPMFETLRLSKAALPADVALIGFCGAPWTVASYMIAGKGTPDQSIARLFAYRFPELFDILIDKLVRSSVSYLCKQLEAGADVVQIFDSWSGVLPSFQFEKWCVAPVKAIIDGVRLVHPQARIIAFPRGAGTRLSKISSILGSQVIGIDTAADLQWCVDEIDPKIVIQGNLDPLALVAGGDALERSIRLIIETMRDRRHIFNLGHGILPETPIENVEKMLKQIRKTG